MSAGKQPFRTSSKRYLSIQVCKFKVEKSAGQTAKAEVRAQACGAGQQGISIHSRTLEISDPCLQQKKQHNPYKAEWMYKPYNSSTSKLHIYLSLQVSL